MCIHIQEDTFVACFWQKIALTLCSSFCLHLQLSFSHQQRPLWPPLSSLPFFPLWNSRRGLPIFQLCNLSFREIILLPSLPSFLRYGLWTKKDFFFRAEDDGRGGGGGYYTHTNVGGPFRFYRTDPRGGGGGESSRDNNNNNNSGTVQQQQQLSLGVHTPINNQASRLCCVCVYRLAFSLLSLSTNAMSGSPATLAGLQSFARGGLLVLQPRVSHYYHSPHTASSTHVLGSSLSPSMGIIAYPGALLFLIRQGGQVVVHC